MNSRWYFSAIIFLLALAGIKMENSSLSNQEIVVHFNDEAAAENQAQNAIAVVKQQLQRIGVENIQIVETADGTLKITYYSDLAVSHIKDILSNAELDIDYTSDGQNEGPLHVPSDLEVKSYELSVHEIQSGADGEADFDGYVIEFVNGKERFVPPVDHTSLNGFSAYRKCSIDKVAYSVNRNRLLFINNFSRHIPEVRAGPVA